jgi:hypothetical protein
MESFSCLRETEDKAIKGFADHSHLPSKSLAAGNVIAAVVWKTEGVFS